MEEGGWHLACTQIFAPERQTALTGFSSEWRMMGECLRGGVIKPTLYHQPTEQPLQQRKQNEQMLVKKGENKRDLQQKSESSHV